MAVTVHPVLSGNPLWGISCTLGETSAREGVLGSAGERADEQVGQVQVRKGFIRARAAVNGRSRAGSRRGRGKRGEVLALGASPPTPEAGGPWHPTFP